MESITKWGTIASESEDDTDILTRFVLTNPFGSSSVAVLLRANNQEAPISAGHIVLGLGLLYKMQISAPLPATSHNFGLYSMPKD